jgi:hypothetical protein
MLLKSKQDAEEFVFWCVTLQCEVLPKGMFALESIGGGVCCLCIGVVCTVSEDKILKYESGRISGGVPNSQENSPEWLKMINLTVQSKTGYTLTEHNDSLNKSHKEIGTLLLGLYEEELNYWLS